MAAETSPAPSGVRSGSGGASADSYVGSLISLTSKSEIRYEGILYNINTEESSIGLRNVRSFGTEGRKKDGPQVPSSDKVYEYILFRGSDIKDLQVKSSPPAPTPPPINSDPAIIQSHYPRPTSTSTSFPTAPTGSLPDISSYSPQQGLPGPNFQGGLPLYQPGTNLNSWAPSPPIANNSGLAMPPMYWQGFYGAPNGLPQIPQQSLFRPPPGLSIPPTMQQQMQFSGFNPSLTMAGPSAPGSNPLPDYNLPPASLPASTFSLNLPPLQPASETTKAPISSTPASKPPSSSLPSLQLPPLSSVPDNTSVPTGPTALPQQLMSQPITSLSGPSGPIITETPTLPLVTPGQLLHTGPATGSSRQQPLQTTHKDVEVVQVAPKTSPEPSKPVAREPQPPILPLPTQNTQAHKPNGSAYHMRNNYRGRGGRGYGVSQSRPMTKFTEDFDFTAMNEKFKKDEVWGHLGKSNKSQSKDGNVSGSDEDDYQYEDDTESPNKEIKPIYNKDDFFDAVSVNTQDNDHNHGRTRFSEQMKLDTETFGDFSSYRGGRRGRGPSRGGGRFRGSYNGRGGYGGYGYGGRGRGRGVLN